jgi:hypothetical protein
MKTKDSRKTAVYCYVLLRIAANCKQGQPHFDEIKVSVAADMRES